MTGRSEHGCRDHVLVLPSVVCATVVARDIARRTGAVSITHQHGCSQIGDDETQTAAALEQIACNPNVGGVLVVSLGCETVQGRRLAERIRGRGQRTEFVGIQDAGGSTAAVDAGEPLARTLLKPGVRRTRDASELVLGIEASRRSPVTEGLARLAIGAGARVVFGDVDAVPEALVARRDAVPAFGPLPEGRRPAALRGAGRGAEQHTALAAAGAHTLVSFPDGDQAAVGFPLCPVVAVSGPSPLHQALAGEFDLDEFAGADALWRLVLAIDAGAESKAESRGHPTFALPRIARTM